MTDIQVKAFICRFGGWFMFAGLVFAIYLFSVQMGKVIDKRKSWYTQPETNCVFLQVKEMKWDELNPIKNFKTNVEFCYSREYSKSGLIFTNQELSADYKRLVVTDTTNYTDWPRDNIKSRLNLSNKSLLSKSGGGPCCF